MDARLFVLITATFTCGLFLGTYLGVVVMCLLRMTRSGTDETLHHTPGQENDPQD